jgi:uncharacterized heparinase superfamily protein
MVPLLLRSLPHLRREQLVYRPWRVFQSRLYRVSPRAARLQALTRDTPPSPRAVEVIRAALDSSFPHLTRPLAESDRLFAGLLADRFTFLNHTLEIEEVDWNRRYASHLWNYQFHYFGYAVPCARAFVERGDVGVMRRCQQLIESWVGGARVGLSDGWDAYPISLRAVNWIYAYALVADVYDDREFLGRWRASIYQQVEFLSRHLEYHLLANHLLKNAKALVIGGLFFADDERGRRWLDEGERLLWRELDEQVLGDGGHYERAPMYHAIALADFVECFALVRAWKKARNERWDEIEEVAARLRAMARFLEAMTYPDGTLALFNDSANADEARPRPIIAAARRVCGEDTEAHAPAFPETGYYAWFSPDGGERVVVDAGPPAARYNAAHAHCDLLSYELWLEGRPFIVDAGVQGYGGDRFREYARSTRAHNTVTFDGREQSEVWGTFRLARRAELLFAEARGDAQAWDFRAAYAPYYDRGFTHERRIERSASGEWVVTDTARGAGAKWAASFIHLHPDVEVRRGDGVSFECRIGSLKLVIEPFAAASDYVVAQIIKGAESPIQGWRFPDFGVAEPSATLKFEYQVKPGEPFGYRIKREVRSRNSEFGSAE